MIRTDIANLIDPTNILEISNMRLKINMAGDQFSLETQGKVRLQIHVRDHDYRHSFILYDQLRFPIFLGWDFLSQNHLTVSWLGLRMTLSSSSGVIAVNEVDVQEASEDLDTKGWPLGTLVAPYDMAIPPGVTTAIKLDLVLEEGLETVFYEMDVFEEFNCKGLVATIKPREFTRYPPFDGVAIQLVCEFSSATSKRYVCKESSTVGTVQFHCPRVHPTWSSPVALSEEDIFNDRETVKELGNAFPQWYDEDAS